MKVKIIIKKRCPLYLIIIGTLIRNFKVVFLSDIIPAERIVELVKGAITKLSVDPLTVTCR